MSKVVRLADKTLEVLNKIKELYQPDYIFDEPPRDSDIVKKAIGRLYYEEKLSSQMYETLHLKRTDLDLLFDKYRAEKGISFDDIEPKQIEEAVVTAIKYYAESMK